jgi:hypothetical protein
MVWLHRFFAFYVSKHPVGSELLKDSDGSNPVVGQGRPRVLAAGRPLLLAAQRAHEVRDDLTLEQVVDMVIAIGSIHGDPRYLEPILQTALDGLRSRPRRSPRRAALCTVSGLPAAWLRRIPSLEPPRPGNRIGTWPRGQSGGGC